MQETRIDQAARQKIEKPAPDHHRKGSEEWSILYRQVLQRGSQKSSGV